MDLEAIDEDYFDTCVQLDRDDLDEHMANFSGQYAYWSHQFVLATEAAQLAKQSYENAKAAALLEYRELDTFGDSKKRQTVDEIQAKVQGDPDVIAAGTRFIRADARRLRLKVMCDAMAHKKDMMQSIGAKLRIEMQRDPIVLAEQTAGRILAQ